MESSRPEMDDSPIDLTWLTDFSMEDILTAQPLSCFQDPQDNLLGFATSHSPLATDAVSVGVPHIPCPPVSSSLCMSTHHSVAMVPQLQEDVDYRTNPHVKPPYSYASLICMAMEASNRSQITLTAIYQWITSNFCYYRHAHPSWQNSIRHSLSSNKGFIKVPREKGEPGKGGYWKLDPQYAQKMKSSAFRSPREPPALTRLALPNSDRQEALRATGPAAAIGSSSKVLSANLELQQLLRDYEEVTGDRDWSAVGGQAGQKRKQPSPSCMPKVPLLSSSDLLTLEEQSELGFLEDVLDWSTVLDTELSGDFSTLGDLQLLPAVSPTPEEGDWTGQGHPIYLLQEQEQVQGLPECRQNSLDLEETFEASSFLQHFCEEEPSVDLAN